MARLHRHFETSDPTLITETTEQDHRVYQETTMCECGCDISIRHLERHRRSKTHAHQMNWRQSVFVAHLQSTVTPQSSISDETEDNSEDVGDDMINTLDDFRSNYLVSGCPVATCIFYNDYCEYARNIYPSGDGILSFEAVDEYMTETLEIVSINDEYCP